MRPSAIAFFALQTAASSVLAQSKDVPVNWKELPPPFHSESVRNRPEVISRPENAELRLPAGFAIEEHLSGFERPRFMLLGPGKEILLTDSGSREARTGVVYLLKDGSRNEAPRRPRPAVRPGAQRRLALRSGDDVGQALPLRRGRR